MCRRPALPAGELTRGQATPGPAAQHELSVSKSAGRARWQRRPLTHMADATPGRRMPAALSDAASSEEARAAGLEGPGAASARLLLALGTVCRGVPSRDGGRTVAPAGSPAFLARAFISTGSIVPHCLIIRCKAGDFFPPGCS